jgi:hypothetical protein
MRRKKTIKPLKDQPKPYDDTTVAELRAYCILAGEGYRPAPILELLKRGGLKIVEN